MIISLRCSNEPMFKLDNLEHLLHEHQVNAILLSHTLTVLYAASGNSLDAVSLKIKPHFKNSRVLIILSATTAGKIYGQRYRDDMYTIYIGIKQHGTVNQLHFLEDPTSAQLSLDQYQLLKVEEPKKYLRRGNNLIVTSKKESELSIITPKSFYDNIYVCCRQSEPAKELKIRNQLDKLRLDYEVFYSNNEIVDKDAAQKNTVAGVIEDAISNNYDSIVILTDNLVINRDFVKISEGMLERHNNWNAFFMFNISDYRQYWKAIAFHQDVFHYLQNKLQKPDFKLSALASDLLLDYPDSVFNVGSSPLAQLCRINKTKKNTNIFLKPTIYKVNVLIDVNSNSKLLNTAVCCLLQQDYPINKIILSSSEKNELITDLEKKYSNITQDTKNLAESDYLVKMDSRSYLPYNFISKSILTLLNQSKQIVKPKIALIDSQYENNIVSKLLIMENPFFISARETAESTYLRVSVSVSSDEVHVQNQDPTLALTVYYDQN